MQKRRVFESVNYYRCVLELAHCDSFGFDKKPIFDKFKNYHLSRKKIDMIYKWKQNNKSKWNFFEKHAQILIFKVKNWNKLKIQDINDITEYKDFFVYRFDGLVYRWDGINEFIDKKGRHLIKTFTGVNKLVTKIIYATRPLEGFHYSYKQMKDLKITSKNGTRNVMELEARK